MLNRINRINALTKLGTYLLDPTNSIENEEVARLARSKNGWFTPTNCLISLESIARNYLDPQLLRDFASQYEEPQSPKKIGVVMAGNIPAVGFHDALCVLISGHHLLAKLSKDDTVLMMYLLTTLQRLEPAIAESITFVDRINAAAAFIATGSDNTARYFEYYFASKPHIIRKNRTSVAVLTGKETKQELTGLVDDILLYFGLGCRNVSKLYVPNGYDFAKLYECAEAKQLEFTHHHKYFNNYEYNKAVLLVNGTIHQDNGFLMVTPNEALVSPLSVVYYEEYESMESVLEKLEQLSDKIQCMVADKEIHPHAVSFGTAQSPGLNDFADGVDTMAFLQEL
ncbi:acyl-CoA reductase [Salmonirosea aquatica]|uniref:Acyl-CoA reductase n=1 Tax=Salmonirosea aquatica TaxID=2654236 RepID=A0A7C9FRP9_9BACT|nr:acyl-CoA reductase [Cytophagaceae bacterium SJW1-29]